MVLTPTVLPNSFGVPPDLSFSCLLQVRGLPRYGFCALEMPLNSFDSHLPCFWAAPSACFAHRLLYKKHI